MRPNQSQVVTHDVTDAEKLPVLHPMPPRGGGATLADVLARGKTYDLVRQGVLEAVKVGTRTFVTDRSLRRYLASLPRCELRGQTPPAPLPAVPLIEQRDQDNAGGPRPRGRPRKSPQGMARGQPSIRT